MAQLLCFSDSSSLQIKRLEASLIRITLPLRPTTLALWPSQRLRKPIFSVSQPPSAMETAPTNNEDAAEMKIHPSKADSSSQTNTSDSSLQNTPQISIPSWEKIVLGAVIVLSLPFCRKVLSMKDVMKSVDSVVEVVQIMAETTKNTAMAVSQALPSGRLKEAAFKLTKVASFVDKRATLTDSIIDRVDDAMSELDLKLQPILNERELKHLKGTIANAVANLQSPKDGTAH